LSPTVALLWRATQRLRAADRGTVRQGQQMLKAARGLR